MTVPNYNLFFELIQTSIGRKTCLTKQPSDTEWGDLYSEAKKQSLVGVCFAGVQRLQTQNQCPPEMLYLQWMGMAAKIQQRNELMNNRSKELQTTLLNEGFNCCILKGQGVALVYGKQLRNLRQSGDIDVLLWKDTMTPSENKKEICEYARRFDRKASGIEHHIEAPVFQDATVELHYTPAYLCNPFDNNRLQRWLGENLHTYVDENGLIVPDFKYNVVILLVHAYRHYMTEGIGLRQVMDYLMLLQSEESFDKVEIEATLKNLGLLKFARGLMWVLHSVFGLPKNSFICNQDEKVGKRLLHDIVEEGNFGHHKKKYNDDNSHVGHFIERTTRSLNLFMLFPYEAIWSPIIMIKNFISART